MFWRHNALGILWAVLILILSGLPGDQFDRSSQEHVDKVIHVVLFALLVLLLTVGFIKQHRFPYLRANTIVKVFVVALAYGIVIEFMQAWVFIHRSIEFWDVIANLVGAGIGVGAFYLIYGTDTYA